MPKRTNAFQRVVAMLNATLAENSHVTESAMLVDKVTNTEREVDVLISTNAANYDVKIGVEVIDWKRPADLPWVERMYAKYLNLEVDKLVLVSRSGFSKPAEKKAKFYGFEALTLEEFGDVDWPLVAKLESIGVFEVVTTKYNCQLLCEFEAGELETIEAPLNTPLNVGGECLVLDSFVRRLVGCRELRDIINSNQDGSENQDFWLSYRENNLDWRVERDGDFGSVQEIRVGLMVIRKQTPVQCARGAYKETPFVAGISSAEVDPLQFVLVRALDGKVKGVLVDEVGIRGISLAS